VSLLVWMGFGAVAVPLVLDRATVAVVGYALLSLTIVRIVPVALVLLGAGLDRDAVLFIGWFGPRGLASIVLTLVALGDGRGIPPFGAEIVGPVALTIALSVIAHGLSAGPAVRRYGAFVSTLPEAAVENRAAADLPTRRGVQQRATGAPRPEPPG
jgi:NhaP-type Na+/H+ or K+/H+ antiporter